jgi:hypothetical protein
MEMLRKALAATLMALILASHFGATLTLRVYATGETDASTALKFMEEELEKGKIPSSSVTEACFIIPEGFPVNLAQKLWFFIAQLVSMGCSEEEIRRTIRGANDTLKLPARIDYGLKDYTIIPKYEEIYISRNYDGNISVEIPYKVVGNDGNEKDVSSIKYKSNGTNVFHILCRYPKKRTYLVRRIDPDSYTFTFIDLETGKVFNKTARMKIGLFSNLGQGYFAENFIIAIPGHLEETHEVVESQVSEFRVLLPAYDPIVVDTSISSTRVGIGDTITIAAQIRNPQDIRGSYKILLGARFSDSDAFETWAPHSGSAYLAPLYLRAKKPGIYTITIYFAVVQPSNLDLVFWNGGKTVTYTVEVLPEPPKLEIKLSSQVVAKFANLTITLINKGGWKARDVKLFITGDVDKKELEIGTIVGLWSKNIVRKLLSPIAKVNVTAVYYDEEGKRYASTALTTISTTNFVAPEEWRTYVIEVEGYNETKKVFVPSYQGATHVKLYLMATGTIPEYFSDFNVVKLIPISPDGFTLTIENASDISKMAKVLNVRYVLIDVKPGFLYERVLREDEVKRLFDINEDERLEPSKIPSNYEVKLLKEEVLNQSELVTVSDEFYEWLKYNRWEDYDHKYEDTGETKWDLNKATTKVSYAKEIELIYHPLAYGGGDLVQGVLIRNYAASDVEYELEVFSGPTRLSPEERAITVSAFGSVPLHLVQLEDIDHPVFFINLKHGDRVVATLRVTFGKGELPEFWKGLWDGFISKGWGIIVTCGIMAIVGFVLPPKWAAAASLIVLVTGVAMNVAEVWTDVHNALAAMDSLNGLADVCEGRAKEFNRIGMVQHANEVSELSQAFRLEARDINDNLLSNIISNLALDVSWDEIRIAFGLEEPPSTKDRDYRIGYATGRVVGAIVSCAAYVTTFYAVVSRMKAERIGGRPLSVKDVLKLVGRGIYNWITPAIFDAIMVKLKPSFHKVTDLLLGNKYSIKFGNAIGDLIGKISDPPKIEDILETASGLSKQVLENVPNKESSGRILDAIGTIVEHYSLEELKKKGEAIVRSIVSIWIKDGDEAIESLNNWLSMNAGDLSKVSALEKTLSVIGGDSVKGVGLKIGNIIDGYLDVKGKYGEDVANAFLNAVFKNPNQLEEILGKLNSFEFKEKPRRVTLRRGMWGQLNLGENNKVKPGTYVIRVYWEYNGESGVMEFPIVRNVESNLVSMSKDEVDRALNQIGRDEAEVSITKAELFDYRIFFSTEFMVGEVKVMLNLFDNEIKIGGNIHKFKPSTDVYGRRIYVNAELDGKNMDGNKLVLAFCSDIHGNSARGDAKEVKIKFGGSYYYVVGIEVDETVNLVIIKWSRSIGGEIALSEYSFNLKLLSEQIGKHPYEFLLREDQKYINLKERLFRLLGYDALKELEEGIGSKCVIFVGFDNGEEAYCGAKRLQVDVPEGASKVEWIEIVPIKDETDHLLCEIIETIQRKNLDRVKIGEAGERIVILRYKGINYQRDILTDLSEEMGILLNELEGKVVFRHVGGGGNVDGEIVANEDIIVNGKVAFKKGDVIAIIEVKSTTSGKSLEKLCDDARDELVKHLFQPDDYKDVPYGVAVGFSYDPKRALHGEPGTPPLIKVYSRDELEKLLGGG